MIGTCNGCEPEVDYSTTTSSDDFVFIFSAFSARFETEDTANGDCFVTTGPPTTFSTPHSVHVPLEAGLDAQTSATDNAIEALSEEACASIDSGGNTINNNNNNGGQFASIGSDGVFASQGSGGNGGNGGNGGAGGGQTVIATAGPDGTTKFTIGGDPTSTDFTAPTVSTLPESPITTVDSPSVAFTTPVISGLSGTPRTTFLTSDGSALSSQGSEARSTSTPTSKILGTIGGTALLSSTQSASSGATSTPLAPTPASTLNELTQGAKIGVGIGVPASIINLSFLGWLVWRMRRRARQACLRPSNPRRGQVRVIQGGELDGNPFLKEFNGQARHELAAKSLQELEGHLGPELDSKRL